MSQGRGDRHGTWAAEGTRMDPPCHSGQECPRGIRKDDSGRVPERKTSLFMYLYEYNWLFLRSCL